MSKGLFIRLPVWFWIWAALVGAVLAMRPALPVDETRYLAVAWEMWWRGSIAVPYLNGEFYDGKPPLFFWLMQLGWRAFGVSEWWPRALAPLFGLADLVLVAAIARRLWGTRQAVELAPVILVGSVWWAFFCASTMFDIMLGFFALASVYALLRAWRGELRYFALAGVALGCGILAKGPVVFLPALAVVLAAPWWMGSQRASWGAWYGGALGAAAIAGLIALAWLVPMGLGSTPDYLENMLFKQTAGYVADSFSHARPVWWYLIVLPGVLFPWTFWPRAWRAMVASGSAPGDPGVRLCLAWAVLVLIVFSLISGKQAHYMLMIFPPVALLLARLLPEADRGRDATVLVVAGALVVLGCGFVLAGMVGRVPGGRAVWLAQAPVSTAYLVGAALIGLACAVAVTRAASLATRVKVLAAVGAAGVVVLSGGFMHASGGAYDVRKTSAVIAALEAKGAPMTINMHYSGEFSFYGRLKSRIEPSAPWELPEWLDANPEGYVIAVYPANQWPPATTKKPVHTALHRGGALMVWRARDVLSEPQLLPHAR
jgi:4-amino-4-deoxy-L-arabinose transferase-like glycosyltransferase